ncbi:MAG: hypothetical protein HOV67_10085, partial [Kribbellaceae bacterium]|nr:hypothetical protein [Kribbellaceae bacterium]
MSWTLSGQVRDSSVPGLLLRAVPGVITILSVVVAAGSHDEQRLPYWAVVVLGVIVVLGNLSLFGLRYGSPPGRAGYGMLAFTIAGCVLWYALPASLMIIIPFWASRAAVRYFRAKPLEWAVVGVSIAGASVPLYVTTRSVPGAFGAAFGVVALTLAAV